MDTITKRDLVTQLSDKTGFTQADVTTIMDSMLDTVISELAKGNAVAIRNFGSFTVREVKGKIGRNPKKPEQMVEIPPRAVVKFKVGKGMRERVARILPVIQQGK
ncbi:MAG: HU family DNA-binding protein [Akkermansiaceae bacterium]